MPRAYRRTVSDADERAPSAAEELQHAFEGIVADRRMREHAPPLGLCRADVRPAAPPALDATLRDELVVREKDRCPAQPDGGGELALGGKPLDDETTVQSRGERSCEATVQRAVAGQALTHDVRQRFAVLRHGTVTLDQLVLDAPGQVATIRRVSTGDDVWTPLKGLVGTWEGEATGKPGRGTQVRRYEWILRGRFLMGTNKTTWDPKEKDSPSEVHEDITLFSYDRGAKRFVMRAFYVEGFACAYVCESLGPDGTLVFVAATVENGPPGMRARETLELRGDDLVSSFDLAMGGGPFAPYTQERLRRR